VIEARGAEEVARRSLQKTDQIFRFGITRGCAVLYPARAFKLKGPPKRIERENFNRMGPTREPVLSRHGLEVWETSGGSVPMKCMKVRHVYDAVHSFLS
jgi:hypothetical protein